MLEAQALYFLKKRKEILIKKKSLGSFEAKKGEDFKFIKAEAPLMEDNEFEAGVKEMLPDKLSKMSFEKLKAIDQKEKFSGKQAEAAVEGLALAAGNDSNKKMTILGDFLYDRIDFDKLENALTQFAKLAKKKEEPEPTAPEPTAPEPTAPETTAPKDDDPESVDPEKTKSFFTKVRESKIVKGVQAQMKKNEIGEAIEDSIHTKDTLVTNYLTAINDANPDNKEDHLSLQATYLKLNGFKQNFTSHIFNPRVKQFFTTKIAKAASAFFGGTTLKEDAAGLLAEIPKIKTTRSRLESIQASLAAPLPSDEG